MSELVRLTRSKGAGGRGDAPPSSPGPESSLDLDAIKTKLASAQGKEYWRSLEELADSEAFQELLHREFPQNASEWIDPVGRRSFLKLMGASLALAGLTACTRQPTEHIAPYVRQPEEIIPGKPLFFATAMSLGGFARGVLVESHEGRPTKIEGNPDHPASLGAADLFAQASILGLYDPDRSQTVTFVGDEKPWSAFLGAIRPAITAQRALKGAGLRILTDTITSPTLANQLKSLLAEMPLAKWHLYEPAGNDNAREGARLAFSEQVSTVYHFDKADVVLSLDSNFMASGAAGVRCAHDFMSRRRLVEGSHEMNRLYTVESTPTITGAKSDHRLPMKPSDIEGFARAIAVAAGVAGVSAAGEAGHPELVAAIARDLKEHRGASIVMAGESQPAAVHVLAHAMNDALGNIGKTVRHTELIETVEGARSLAELAGDLKAGQVDVLIILGGNPVYTAPIDLDFGEALRKARLRVHLSLYQDETSELCQWHIPETHYLESWSDARAFDGTASIIQPLIAPLYRGKTAHEVVAALSDRPERPSYQIVREYWKTRLTGNFERGWRKALHDGVIAGTAAAEKRVALKSDWAQALRRAPEESRSELEVVFRTDPTIYDGRFANNGWLQELQKPLTTLTWDNAAMISPATARRLGLESLAGSTGGEFKSDVVELEFEGRKVTAPVWILPGQPDDCVTLHLGYGRTRAGRVGGTRGGAPGFNAYRLRTSNALWSGTGLRVTKIGSRASLAATQLHHLLDFDDIEKRDIIRSGTLEHYKKHPSLKEEHKEHPPASLYADHKYEGYAWGMSIDVNACIGCNACIVACQAENNIPVVGKEQVLRSREMHWLRVDNYYKGGEANPNTYFQPLPCMQCENAPCEVVCPVAATAHSAEGLNDMVYNRCVGTRYCSNNCPYKVRRFNFLLYQDFETASLKMLRNPDVSVRSRGVMEKCTYCVQRINRVKIEAQKQGRLVRDGEIVPACAQTCPTQAIVFGDINDKNSRVSKLKAEHRNYSLLPELNNKPRTTYLGAVRNPNPEAEKA